MLKIYDFPNGNTFSLAAQCTCLSGVEYLFVKNRYKRLSKNTNKGDKNMTKS